ncbi:uncharacterized protein LOC117651559 [Thrips palmi]|uniref:Uncharacterized protein LOC117651559 n=1 Tax=Thrips palmi TaxID=161013 RepID=A0A6P9A1A9_THRPL|nr:uncharacterized protein LOC117651559 [Thrips palmi]
MTGRRRAASGDRPAAKKSKSQDPNLVWIICYPRTLEAPGAVSASERVDLDRLRQEIDSSVRKHVLSIDIVTADLPVVSASLVCEESKCSRAINALHHAFAKAAEAVGCSWGVSDFMSLKYPLPPSLAPRQCAPVLQWYKVSAPPLEDWVLEHELRKLMGPVSGVMFARADSSHTILALIPPQSAADLSTQGLTLVQEGINRVQYCLPAVVEAIEEAPVIAPPAWSGPINIPRGLTESASKTTQTDPLPPTPPPSVHKQQQPEPQPRPRRPRRRRRPIVSEEYQQCFKCQQYGHRADQCDPEAQVVCRVCSEAHRASECNRKDSPKCANCGASDHGASSRRCSRRPRPPPVGPQQPRPSAPRVRRRGPGNNIQGNIQRLLSPLVQLIAAIGAFSNPHHRKPPYRQRKPPEESS